MKKWLGGWLFGMVAFMAEAACPDQTLHIQNKAGETHIFQTEVACTAQQRAQGLQFRIQVPAQTGMLFPSDTPRQFVMWMKDTLVPLDMLFIDRQGIIRHIAYGQPKSEDLIYGPQDMCAVLELAGGEAEKHHIEVGDRVTDDIFCLDNNR